MGKKKKIKKMLKERKKQSKASGLVDIPKRRIGAGKPSLYKHDFVRMVNRLAMLGLNNPQMAEVLGVKTTTFMKWLDKYPEFREAMHEGKVMADAVVAESLYKNAVGYEHPTVKVLSNRVKKYDKDGKVIEEFTEPVLVPLTKHYQPNFNAQKHWLSIRQRAIWKDTEEFNANVNITTMDLKDFKDEELEKMLVAGFKLKRKSIKSENDDFTDYEEVD